ncbi:MAG: FHA domain-containing protein [Anaerolineae bacterium]|nr:FHA domain-containing protein [Anaerolineae bacterium]
MPPSDQMKTTRTLREMARVVVPPSPVQTGPLNLAPWVMELRVVGTAATLQINVRDHMLIGRSDAERGINPEIDLTEPDGLGKGVSRRHASINVHDERVFIRDLGSTNGTLLNGVPCEPLKEYRLRHGDELALGNLRLQVIFSVVPAKDITATGFKRLDIPHVGAGERILLVEDDKDVGAVVRMALERAGFRPELVTTVTGALEQTAATLPSVVIVDMMLAEMNALDFVRHLRRQPNGAAVGIIVTSSATGGFQMNQAIEAGADRFLGKPVALDELVRTVDTVRKRGAAVQPATTPPQPAESQAAAAPKPAASTGAKPVTSQAKSEVAPAAPPAAKPVTGEAAPAAPPAKPQAPSAAVEPPAKPLTPPSSSGKT